ncbi:MAG TPA: thiolase family protein [Dehalococcoidia bacterium]|nr:thiolase family protein [Dehalococcoidia bacterium]
MSLRGKAAIVGIGELKPTRYSAEGETTISLMAKAGIMAIEDSGIPFDEIDGLVLHPIPEAPLVPSTMAEFLGLKINFAEIVDLGGAVGAGQVWRAAAAIASGLCHSCLCLTGEARPEAGGARIAARDHSAYSEFESPYGAIGANYGYALVAQRYMAEYGVKPETLAKIAVQQRYNACANPDAIFYGQPITVEDVLKSPPIVEPLHMLEIVMPTAGAAALVVTSAERARTLKNPPAYLLGAGERLTHKTLTYAPSITTTPIKEAADRAFRMAGVNRSQIGLAEIYDCYTITVLVSLEDAGFCRKGEGPKFVEEHDFRYHGDFPMNTHGGQLSFGQPGLAGGMSQVTEAARQIMGRGGQRQAKDTEFVYVNGNGGFVSEQVSLILGRNP